MPFAPCVCIGILLLPWFPCTWEKCIFDQVQRSIKVVSPPTGQYTSGHWSLSETASEENPVPHSSKHQRPKRAERHVESMTDPQPIRIKSWVPSESPARHRMGAREINDCSRWGCKRSFPFTVRCVVFFYMKYRQNMYSETEIRIYPICSYSHPIFGCLLIVRRVQDSLLLNRDINKYCKFIWRNSSTVNHMKYVLHVFFSDSLTLCTSQALSFVCSVSSSMNFDVYWF